ncbi:MAG: TonB-dependent receptor [Pseudomonadota bacterium]
MKSAVFGSLLMLSSALVAPGVLANSVADQSATSDTQVPDVGTPDVPARSSELEQEAKPEIEISGPIGGLEEIVVRGKFIPDVVRANPVVVSVLSSEQIERTGDGDIAGSLSRVTGLSLVGGRFVYVRGLGERYSQALLNGLPLPSPEPLRRVVPLDLFPTDIIASSAVQKTYSPGFPGEFGGGAINLTTKSAPDEPFLKLNVGIGGNTETTGELGLTHFGSRTDWTGFDNGTRDIPGALSDAFGRRSRVDVNSPDFSEEEVIAITQTLQNASTNLIQRNQNIPIDGSFSITGGTTFEVGDETSIGVFGNFGWSNEWRTRGGVQQVGQIGGDGLTTPVDFRYMTTLNNIIVNGILGFTAEVGEHTLRWTNIYIRDSLKETQIRNGFNDNTVGTDAISQNDTAWYERQLIDTQFVGEFRWGDWGLNVRGTYAESSRDAPYERENDYVFNEVVGDFVNDLQSPGQGSRISFSDLTDEVIAGGGDVFYDLPTDRPMKLTAGYAYLDNSRNSTRRTFRYFPQDGIPLEVAQQRPDFLLSDFNAANFGVLLQETTAAINLGAPSFDANLTVNAAYVQLEAELLDGVSITTGVRYEDAEQTVTPLPLFLGDDLILENDANRPAGVPAEVVNTQLNNDYFLPALTVTYNFYDDMQLRFGASKTIARPQFRELAPQFYNDPDADRTFRGNQFLTDSELLNFDVRYEWFFAQDERFTVSAFYKDIDNPIETLARPTGDTIQTTFGNAPKATLYGAEIELEKYFDLYDLTDNAFFSDRRIYLNANYTYTKSELQVSEGDVTTLFDGREQDASLVFIDGLPLTGQSKHLANLQIGLEHPDFLSQQTIILNYASPRVSLRGPRVGEFIQPDIIEKPGVILDVVIRQGFELGGTQFELKLDGRNLLNTDFSERQSLNGTEVIVNEFQRGRSFSISVGAEF